MQDDFRGEISLYTSGQSANVPDIPRPILEALHKTILGPQETLKARRAFPVRCKPNDISQLVSLLNQWVRPYGPISNVLRLTCVVVSNDSLRGDKKLGFASLEEFLSKYPAITDTTRSIELVFDCVFQAPDRGTLDSVQATIVLRALTSGYDSYKQDGDSETRYFSDEDFNLILSMKYSDYLVAKSLAAIIEDWFRNLESISIEKRLAEKFQFDALSIFNEYSFSKIYARVFPVVTASFFVIAASRNGLMESQTSTEISALVTTGVIFWGIAYTVTALILGKISKIRLPRMRHLALSDGDIKQLEKSESLIVKRRNQVNFWVSTLGVSFLVGVAASLFANILQKLPT
jgi:hypothetical protein